MIERMSDGTEQQYEIYSLVDKYDDALITYTPDFDFANPSIDPRYLAVSLVKTMMKHGGVGLAAPQCGILQRVFVMGSEGGQGFACFNPVILSATGATAFEEGCLSFKGLYLNIKRPEWIEVSYQDMNGQLHQTSFTGLTSRTTQHELDHLNGVVYTSLVDRYTLDKAKKKVKSNIKKLAAQRANWEKQRVIQQAMVKVAEENRIAQLNKEINISIPNIDLSVGSNIEIPVPSPIVHTGE